MTDHPGMSGGFANPVFDAQKTFRAIMEAMARPGTVMSMPDTAFPPEPLFPIAGSLAITLVDQDTTFWLDGALSANASVAQWFAFQTGGNITRNPEDADFAFVADVETMPALESFKSGPQEYPDRSTTIVLQMASLDGGSELILKGPGVDGQTAIAPSAMPRDFLEQWESNRNRFPRGVDIILCSPGAIAALPRSAEIANLKD